MDAVRLTNPSLMPVVQGVSILLHRGISWWWNGRTAEEKQWYRKKAEDNRNVIWYCSVGAAGLGVATRLFFYRPVMITMVNKNEYRMWMLKTLLIDEWTAIILSGLGRLWWHRKTSAKKEWYQNQVRKNKNIIWCAGTAICTGLCVLINPSIFTIPDLTVDSVFMYLYANLPFMKMMAVFSGLAMRLWWWQQTKDAKQWYRDVVNKNKNVIKYGGIVGCATFQILTLQRIETDPSTGRTRLFLFSDKNFKDFAEESSFVETVFGPLMDAADPAHGRLVGLLTNVLTANPQARRDYTWAVNVVDYSNKNVFTLPNGHIYVTTEFLRSDIVTNDDRLSIVLSHEMSHCLQRHANQNLSVKTVVDLLSLTPMLGVWLTKPYFDAVKSHLFIDCFKDLFILLPFSRFLETEADRDGLMLAAAVPCLDVDEGYRFFNALDDTSNQLIMGSELVDYLFNKFFELFSTHPCSKDRAKHLYSLIPAVKELQKTKGSC